MKWKKHGLKCRPLTAAAIALILAALAVWGCVAAARALDPAWAKVAAKLQDSAPGLSGKAVKRLEDYGLLLALCLFLGVVVIAYLNIAVDAVMDAWLERFPPADAAEGSHGDPDAPSIPISPSLWNHWGARLLFVGPRWVDPRIARHSAWGWIAGVSLYCLAIGYFAATGNLSWPVGLISASVVIPLLGGALPRVRTMLARRRVEIQVLDCSPSARPGEAAGIVFTVRAVGRVVVRTVTVILACFEESTGCLRSRRRCLHFQELPGISGPWPARGEPFRGHVRFEVPADAPATWTALPRKICWVVAVVVDMPGWPDLEEVRELRVERKAHESGDRPVPPRP